MSPKKQNTPIRKIQPGIFWFDGGKALVVLLLFSVIGVSLARMSSAVTINPYGGVDYCELSGTTTIIYGWAADPNATSLTQPSVSVTINGAAKTFLTDKANFRTVPIHAFIDRERPGDPKPGTYGFQARYTNLYKGTKYALGVTALNVGAGANVVLTINQTNTLDGQPRNGFPGKLIPDVCLSTRPVVPPPTPPPPVTPPPVAPPPPVTPPAPVNPPAPRPTPPPAPRRATPAPVPTPRPAAVELSAAADAVIASGTQGVELRIPAGGATRTQVIYSTNPMALDTKSAEADFGGGPEAVIQLGGLKPRTTYTYQIVRTAADGRTVPSNTSTFTTAGIDITVTFVRGKQPVRGVKSKLSATTFTGVSDSKGMITFINMVPGDYNLSYSYESKNHTEKIKVPTPGIATDSPVTQISLVSRTIDISHSAVASVDKTDNRIMILIVAGGVLTALILTFVGWRRSRQADKSFDSNKGNVTTQAEPVGDTVRQNDQQMPPPPAAPNYYADEAPLPPETLTIPMPPPSAPPAQPLPNLPLPPAPSIIAPPQPNPAHMGQSLRDMVLESMAEESKQQSGKKPDEQQ